MNCLIVVPTKNNERTLENCLRSIKQQTYTDITLIVVDNNSTDNTVKIAEMYADKVIQAGPERSAQRNAGAKHADGEAVMFIDSDMILTTSVVEDAMSKFKEGYKAVIVPERSFGTGFFAQCRALEKRMYIGDDSVEAPRLFDVDLFWKVGGWDETLTAAEDWDLADRVKAAGVSIGRINSLILHDEGTIKLRQTYQKKKYYGKWVKIYLDRNKQGSAHLKRTQVLKKAPVMLADPVHGVGLVVLKTVEGAGLWSGSRA